MQHALLGLAIAVILAIAAALAAPAYVNWNDWRGNFESHASWLAGAPVRIGGAIEAKILPTPAFVFRDVTVGNPEKGSGARIGEVRGVLSLGSLLRGEFKAEEFILVRPEMRIAAASSGEPLLRTAQNAAAAAGVIAAARVAIERGALVFDRDGEKTVFDDIYAEGEMRSRQGPMRFDGVFRRDGRRWGLRVNAGQFNNGTGRVRITVEQAGAGRTFDADGTLFLAGAAPRFEGRLEAASRPAAGTAAGPNWQVTANAKAAEDLVTLDAFQLVLGKDAAPTDLAGQMRIQPWRGGTIGGSLTARRLDLDTALGGNPDRGIAAAFAPLREPLALLESLPLRGQIGFSAEAIAAGGGAMRDVRAELVLQDGALSLERLEASLPGRGIAVASGSAAGGARFSGRASVQAEDSAALVRWALGGHAAALRNTGPFRLAGRLDWRDSAVAVRELEFSFGDTKLGGGIEIERGVGAKRARIAADIVADGADLDMLQPAAAWIRGETAQADVSLKMRGSGLRVLDRTLGRIDASLVRSSEGVAVERLVLEDFDGLTVHAEGRIAAPVERPSGKIDFDLATTRPDGLAALVHEYLGGDAARLVRHAAGSGSPLKLAGTATGAGSAAGIEVNASGTLGDMDAALVATFDLLTEKLAEGQMRLEAREPKSLSILFGLSPGLPAAGSGVLEIDLSKPEGGVLPVQARLSVPGTDIAAQGDLRADAEGRIEPRLDVKVDAANLRYLLAAAAQASGNDPVRAEGGLHFTRTGDGFEFRDIALDAGGAKLAGSLSASALAKPVLGGKLAVSRAGAGTLLALAVGRAPDDKAFWRTGRIAPAALADAAGAIELEIGELYLPGGQTATAAKLRLRLGANTAAFENLEGEIAGGRFTGHASFVRGDAVAFDGRISIRDFDAAQMISRGEGGPEVRGRGSLTLSLAGNGASPAALAGSLAGQGTIALENLEIDRADPDAVAVVFAVDEKFEPRDEISALALLSPALAAGTLKIGKIEAPIVVAGGNARTVTARASAGDTRVEAEANLDLARLTLDAALEFEIDGSEGLAVRPGATLRWRGPLGAIERGVEAAALANAINLRAMERETRRIELRDRNAPPVPQRSQQPPRTPNPVASAPALSPPDPSAPPITVLPAPVPVPAARPKGAEPPRSVLPPLVPFEFKPLPPVYQPN